MEEKKGRPINIWISQDTIDEMDRLAKKAGITRSKLAANILETTVPELLRYEKIGVLQIAVVLRDLEDRIREWVNGAGSGQEVEA